MTEKKAQCLHFSGGFTLQPSCRREALCLLEYPRHPRSSQHAGDWVHLKKALGSNIEHLIQSPTASRLESLHRGPKTWKIKKDPSCPRITNTCFPLPNPNAFTVCDAGGKQSWGLFSILQHITGSRQKEQHSFVPFLFPPMIEISSCPIVVKVPEKYQGCSICPSWGYNKTSHFSFQ